MPPDHLMYRYLLSQEHASLIANTVAPHLFVVWEANNSRPSYHSALVLHSHVNEKSSMILKLRCSCTSHDCVLASCAPTGGGAPDFSGEIQRNPIRPPPDSCAEWLECVFCW
jgi:hypothetical protein